MKNTTTTNAPVDTQMAHTPGPWEIDGSDIRRQGGYNIATMRCFGTHALSVAKEANARLIAASPCLLSALERLANAVDAHCRDITTAAMIELDDATINARAAIAIAKGGAK
jgi:hypothetical protein